MSPFAIAIRQPWAALIVHGRKTIEVRRWPTRRRGLVLIHASKLPDERDEAWQLVRGDAVLRVASGIAGGVIGCAELIDCKNYTSPTAFATDRPMHFNRDGWFRPPVLYGFVLASARPLPFFACPGNTAFFAVPGYEMPTTSSVPPAEDRRIVVPPPEG